MKQPPLKEKCKEKDCKRKVFRKGWCRGHFGIAVAEFVAKDGSPTPAKKEEKCNIKEQHFCFVSEREKNEENVCELDCPKCFTPEPVGEEKKLKVKCSGCGKLEILELDKNNTYAGGWFHKCEPVGEEDEGWEKKIRNWCKVNNVDITARELLKYFIKSLLKKQKKELLFKIVKRVSDTEEYNSNGGYIYTKDLRDILEKIEKL